MEMLDKITLRIILAAAGVLLLLGIYLWDRWKKRRREVEETLRTLDASLPENDFELEEIDTISINPAEETVPPDPEVADAEKLAVEEAEHSLEEEPPGSTPRPADLPELIQVSIAAPRNQPFRGPELSRLFGELELEYGEMEIFHYHQGGQIQFSVATLVKPGTFPIDAMEDFHTPGLTLFMQPPLVDRPLEAFEKMIQTCHILAQRLGGSELDERRQPLTSVRLAQWRRRLRGEG